MIFGVYTRFIVIGLLILALIGGGAWMMNQRNKVNLLEKENLEAQEAIKQYRKQEKIAISITEKKQVAIKKASKIKEQVNEETNKPEYSVSVPESGRMLINTAISDANSYISSSY